MAENIYRGHNEGERGYEEGNTEEIQSRHSFERRVEFGPEMNFETKMPRERKVVADESIRNILENQLEMIDPEGEVSIVFIEYVESGAGERIDRLGLDRALEMADQDGDVIITGWESESDYEDDLRWQSLALLKNVYFVKLPFSLSQLKNIVERIKAIRRADGTAI